MVDDGCVDILVDGKPARTVMPATPRCIECFDTGNVLEGTVSNPSLVPCPFCSPAQRPVEHADDCNVRSNSRIGSLQCDCGFTPSGGSERA